MPELTISDAEWLVMQAVWRRGQATAAEVIAARTARATSSGWADQVARRRRWRAAASSKAAAGSGVQASAAERRTGADVEAAAGQAVAVDFAGEAEEARGFAEAGVSMAGETPGLGGGFVGGAGKFAVVS